MLRRDHFKLPKSWEVIAGADTGTYMGGACAAIDPNYELYILDIYPNYHYTGDGTIELLGMTVNEWFKGVSKSLQHWTKQRKNRMWVDANTTFKSEVAYGVGFRMNHRHLEVRTEITREYLRNGRLHILPWVSDLLVYELEEAAFPEAEQVGTGRLVRLKKKDHCLDGVEHICSRRPHPDMEDAQKKQNDPFARLKAQHVPKMTHTFDPHLGQN